MRLRERIAFNLNKEFGEHYSKLRFCYNKEDYETFEAKANELINNENLDDDILDFLFQTDCRGKISYKVCKKYTI